MNLPFGNADQLSVNKQRLFSKQIPVRSSCREATAEQEIESDLCLSHLPGLCCHVNSHITFFFFIPVYATEERLFECHQQMLCHVTHSVQMWYLFRERRLPAFLTIQLF